MKHLSLLFLIVLMACKGEEKVLTAQDIIDKAIENAGGDRYDNAEITFTFRNIIYKSIRQNGQFSLQRILPDTLNTTDIITNTGFTRIQKNEKVQLADTTAFKYMESVNSVHYFMHLPYGLNDPAVKKRLLDPVTIKGKDYHKVEVTFEEEGGGVDFQDIFIYWISKNDFTIGYLAYRFFTDQGGIRFRESYNPRVVEGIRFADYKNYRIETTDVDFYRVDELFEQGELIELSDIKKEKINVKILIPGSE
jgi:hypothetical protein